MELDRAFFDKWGGVAKATTDPKLRLERELCLAYLWKRFGPGQWTGDGFEAKLDASKREIKKMVDDAFAKGTRELLQLAGQGRTEHPRANQVSELQSVDTSRAKFQPVLVTVQPGESVQAAALRAAREDRQTNELETSPARPWTKPQDRYMDQPMRPPDGEIEKAFRASKAQTNDELERLNVERISSAGSLRCRRCGQKFFAKMFGKPLDDARKHAEVHVLADRMNLTTPSHDLYRSTPGGNRNF